MLGISHNVSSLSTPLFLRFSTRGSCSVCWRDAEATNLLLSRVWMEGGVVDWFEDTIVFDDEDSRLVVEVGLVFEDRLVATVDV